MAAASAAGLHFSSHVCLIPAVRAPHMAVAHDGALEDRTAEEKLHELKLCLKVGLGRSDQCLTPSFPTSAASGEQ